MSVGIEPLFGKCGDAKLIVSVSLGNFALFRWRRQSCPSDEGGSCQHDHGDILVMDGQCQDEFLHRTDPGQEQDRINITFRWVKQHVSSCPLLKAGVACCLPTCAKGSSVPVMEKIVNDVFLGFVVSSWCLVMSGVLVFLGSLLCTRLGLLRCASSWTRPSGGGRWGHYLCNLWGEHLKIHKTVYKIFGIYRGFLIWKPHMPALAGQPSLHGYDACWFIGIKGHSGEIAGQNKARPLFLLIGFFCSVGTREFGSGVWFCGICGWRGPSILGLALPVTLLLRSSMLGVGLLMVILLLVLVLIFLLLLSIG